jgi:hypothetical protein
MNSADDEQRGESDRVKRYAPGNTREDGGYIVGKNRPPERTRFRASDGRPRGRRPKGQRNFDTEFEEESRRRITIREGANERHVSKRHATIIRTYDNALTKGDTRAASLLFSHSVRIGDQGAARGSDLTPDDDEELNTWLRERLALLEDSELVPSESENEQ